MSTDEPNLPASDRGNLLERIAFAFGFAVVAYLTLMLLFTLAVAQFVLRAVNSKPNDELTDFIRRLSRYLAQVTQFVALSSDDRPFPFGDFPASGE